MKRDVLRLGWSAFAATLGLAGSMFSLEARAEEPPPLAVSGPSCKVKGTAPVPKGTKLHDELSGGRVIATFTGALVPMTLSEIPLDPTAGRARLSTVDSSPALRIDGYLAPSEVPLYTARDIPVVGSHVWISSGQKVKIAGATADSLRVELAIAGSQGQTVRATSMCDAFSLQRGAGSRMEVPGNARGYLMKSQSIDFYDAPKGDVVFSLKMMEGTAQLFWSTEAKNGFVHLMSRGDISIDAWARLADLSPLKKGEMMDQYIPPTTAVAGAMLALDKPPPLVKAAKAVPIRARRDEKEKPVGEIEVGADVYVLETVAGWTNVLPKTLGVTPPDEGGFWIPASEAPK